MWVKGVTRNIGFAVVAATTYVLGTNTSRIEAFSGAPFWWGAVGVKVPMRVAVNTVAVSPEPF